MTLGLSLPVVSLVLLHACLVEAQDIPAPNVTAIGEDERPSIEEKILGPLRVWHIVFIVVSILFVILVVVCCCLDIRVPRTRQEIEQNFQKRQINAKYLRALERNPDQVIQEHRDEIEAGNDRIETVSQLVAPMTFPKPASAKDRLKRVVELSSARREGGGRGKMEDDGRGKRLKAAGIGQALPVNPRDILALVAQQKKLTSQQRSNV